MVNFSNFRLPTGYSFRIRDNKIMVDDEWKPNWFWVLENRQHYLVSFSTKGFSSLEEALNDLQNYIQQNFPEQ